MKVRRSYGRTQRQMPSLPFAGDYRCTTQIYFITVTKSGRQSKTIKKSGFIFPKDWQNSNATARTYTKIEVYVEIPLFLKNYC